MRFWTATLLALVVVVGAPFSVAGEVNVSGGVNIQFGNPPPPPPPVVVMTPPTFVLIPGSVVSYAPSLKVDIFLHQGKYYYFHNSAWFVASAHAGPWVYVATPPPAIVGIPVAYYKVPPGHLKKLSGPPGHARDGKGKKGKD